MDMTILKQPWNISKITDGVYAPYKNTGKEMQIFPANSMLKYDIYSDEIRGIGIRSEEKIC